MASSLTEPQDASHAARIGLAALLVGLGLGRFAYTPLLPAMVAGGWFSAAEATSAGAANLIAYLIGAVLASPAARLIPLPSLMRIAVAMTTATFAGCATRPSLWAFLLLRRLAGIAGGAIIVLGPPALLAKAPATRRGRTSGWMSAGVGLGIAAASGLLPVLLRFGVASAWWGLAVGGAMATAVAWHGWPPAQLPPPAERSLARGDLLRLVSAYTISAVALVPHMLLISDCVARPLGGGVVTGALAFVAYGIGAALGPVLGGRLGDRFGFQRVLSLAIVAQVAAVTAPALIPTVPGAIVSALIVGALTPGLPPLVLNRAVELAGAEEAARTWGTATIGYAVGQAIGAWATATAFAALGDHRPLFVGAGLIAVAAFALLPRR
ncbi:MAG: MFS transporter [Elioraea sp.]|nr:MFS transporter [Elioraea sp.]